MDEMMLLLNKVMDATALRHRVLANNLANTDTPQYKRMDVAFRDQLVNALQAVDPEKLSRVEAQVYTDTATPAGMDGNNVSLQKELGEMSENKLLYQFATNAIKMKFKRLEKAITGA